MGLSVVRADQPARIVPEVVRVSLWAVLGLWLARRLGRLLLLILRSPTAMISITVAVLATLGWQLVHPALPLGVVGGLAGGLVVWRVRWPDSFSRHVRCRVRGWLRGAWIYRIRWTAAMDTAGLLVARHGTDYVPPLLKVRSTRSVDRVTVKMLAGQTIDDYAAVADRLAQTFGAADCRVRSIPGRRHLLQLWLLICDPLEDIVAPFKPDPDCLTAGVPVARVEDGTVWRLPLLGNHILIVGATGAGKASVIWSIVAGLVDHIADGVVKVWAVDPKGGMELAPGRHLFDRFAHGDSRADGGYENGLAQLLEDALVVMRERQDRLRGVTQLHTPSVAEPLIVLIIDELAALTGWVNDRTIKRRIEAALGLLLSQGRAAGVLVVGAIQDPRKDVLPQRDLLPVRIGLRMTEAEHVALVLGHGARNRGASCDRIPHRLPGVAFVEVDGIAEPVRVRFARYTFTDITHLSHTAELLPLPITETTAA